MAENVNGNFWSVTLYAVWEREAAPTDQVNTWADLKYMQNMTSAACTSAPSKTAKTLTDSRDNSTYSVTKLDDGKCWMTTNLRLVNKTITSSDSNVSSNYMVPASSSPWRSSTTDTNGNSGATTQLVHYANNTTNGAYYTWCAATAGSCVDNGEAKYSICPKGWRLPTKAEYDTLLGKGYGDKSTIETNKGLTIGGGFFAAVGRVTGGSLNNVGSYGTYWSSTANGSNNAYDLYFSSSAVGTTNSDRYFGFSVRCIAL